MEWHESVVGLVLHSLLVWFSLLLLNCGGVPPFAMVTLCGSVVMALEGRNRGIHLTLLPCPYLGCVCYSFWDFGGTLCHHLPWCCCEGVWLCGCGVEGQGIHLALLLHSYLGRVCYYFWDRVGVVPPFAMMVVRRSVVVVVVWEGLRHPSGLIASLIYGMYVLLFLGLW